MINGATSTTAKPTNMPATTGKPATTAATTNTGTHLDSDDLQQGC